MVTVNLTVAGLATADRRPAPQPGHGVPAGTWSRFVLQSGQNIMLKSLARAVLSLGAPPQGAAGAN